MYSYKKNVRKEFFAYEDEDGFSSQQNRLRIRRDRSGEISRRLSQISVERILTSDIYDVL